MDNSQLLKDWHQMEVEFSSLMSDDSTKEKKLNEKGKFWKGSVTAPCAIFLSVLNIFCPSVTFVKRFTCGPACIKQKWKPNLALDYCTLTDGTFSLLLTLDQGGNGYDSLCMGSK